MAPKVGGPRLEDCKSSSDRTLPDLGHFGTSWRTRWPVPQEYKAWSQIRAYTDNVLQLWRRERLSRGKVNSRSCGNEATRMDSLIRAGGPWSRVHEINNLMVGR